MLTFSYKVRGNPVFFGTSAERSLQEELNWRGYVKKEEGDRIWVYNFHVGGCFTILSVVVSRAKNSGKKGKRVAVGRGSRVAIERKLSKNSGKVLKNSLKRVDVNCGFYLSVVERHLWNLFGERCGKSLEKSEVVCLGSSSGCLKGFIFIWVRRQTS